MDTGKPGPFAVSGFVPGCGVNITKPQVPPRPLERSARHSICLRHAHSSTLPSALFTSASQSMMVASIWILLTTVGVLSRSDPMDGRSSPVRRSDSAGRPACCHFRCRSRGGSLEALTSFFNVANRSDFVLVMAWLLAALRHGGPYPLLAVSGEQGSAKTVFSKMLRGLIDPNAAPVRTAPREERDLFIAASNGHLLAFDNLSDLPAWMSDALCRLASGGSFAVRQLYTDRDEVLFQAARPIILNGIEDVITRPDLADRAIFLNLPHLQEERRRAEKEIWRDFETAQPRILGALLDAASHGLRALPEVRLEQLPRMADFALWATACEPVFCPASGFLHAYKANRRSAIEDVVDADPVAARIRDIMAERTMWSGSASDLLRVAAPHPRDDASWTGAGWPRSPRALAGRLRRAQTPLRALGIEITFGREGRAGTRIIRMTASRPKPPAATVSTVSTVGKAID